MPQVPAPISEADYETIEAAVMETERGRWFLSEYARRNRHADTRIVLSAIERLEGVLRGPAQAHPAGAPVDRFRVDLVDMASAIARTKAEIASIKPNAENHGKIGEATGELDSIVRATETATSDILAAAEEIQEIAWTLREQGLDSDTCDRVDARTTAIYTACSFQDLTGQRTQKVIQVLRYLENRIDAMMHIWGAQGAAAETSDSGPQPGREELLNGPARPGLGLDQSDVDIVMAPAASDVRAAASSRTPSESKVENESNVENKTEDEHPVEDAASRERAVPAEGARLPEPPNLPRPAESAPPQRSDHDDASAARPALPQAAKLGEPASPIAARSTTWNETFATIMNLAEEEKLALFS